MSRPRFIDGYDACAFDGLEKYVYIKTSNAFGFYTSQGVMLPSVVGGNNTGHSMFVFNNGFSEANWTKRLDPQEWWIVGLDFRPQNATTTGVQQWASSIWLRFQAVDATLISVELQTDGTMKVRKGGDGSNGSGVVIASIPHVFTVDVWAFLEIRIRFAHDGDITFWIDGAQIFRAEHVDTLPGTDLPDSITRRWQSFGFKGYRVDNVYYADGGDGDHAPLGRARITSYRVTGRGPLQLAAHGAASNVECVDDYFRFIGEDGDNGPDGDATYVDGTGTDFYKFTAASCYGRILALAINVDVKRIAGDVTVSCIIRKRGVDVPAGSFVATAAYKVGQILVRLSPFTGTYWTDAEIAECSFGVTTSAAARITQVYLEKLVTLVPGVPYDCGRNSYAF